MEIKFCIATTDPPPAKATDPPPAKAGIDKHSTLWYSKGHDSLTCHTSKSPLARRDRNISMGGTV